jgi:hypothetical protein
MSLSFRSCRRLAPRALVVLALLGVAGGLSGCEQVQVISSAPVSASFDAKQGNDPLAAADAASLQEALRVRSQVWTIRLDTTPTQAGAVDVKNAQSVRTGRGKATTLTMTLTATAQATIEGFSSRGAQDEELYCESLIQAIAQAGYTGLHDIHVEVYFNGSHHATLAWTASTGFTYKVLDGKP